MRPRIRIIGRSDCCQYLLVSHITGLEGCQCRKARIVRNHIACAILVWVRLKQVANETKQTVYHLKHGLLSDYMRQQLKSPATQMALV